MGKRIDDHFADDPRGFGGMYDEEEYYSTLLDKEYEKAGKPRGSGDSCFKWAMIIAFCFFMVPVLIRGVVVFLS